MRISYYEASKIINALLSENSFTTKQILKILATSADELEFPSPYENLMIKPTNNRDEFILCYQYGLSKVEAARELVKRLLDDSNSLNLT